MDMSKKCYFGLFKDFCSIGKKKERGLPLRDRHDDRTAQVTHLVSGRVVAGGHGGDPFVAAY